MIDLKNSWDVADTSNRHHVGPVKDQADRVKSHHPVAFAPGLKRGDRRFIVNQPARLSIPGSNAPACEARIRDISHRGMQFAVSQPIQGPRIRIDWNGREIYATVRYLQPDDNGYRLGVEVASAWESLVSDILAQQALELEQSNAALREQAEVLKRAEEQLISYSGELVRKNEELSQALDAARQASSMAGRFFASVSHELRTPLNGIIGFAQLFFDGALGPVNDLQRECLGDMLNCSDHLLELISDVLDLNKIESGRMTFDYVPISLAHVLTESIDTLRPIADSKQVEITFRMDSKVDSVLADSGRLKQILYNYLSNAIKFTGTGGRIHVSVSMEDGVFYRIDVEDNGIGISAGDIPFLFSEFGQLGDSKKSKIGCGLGLAISKRIAEAQGGRVGVASELGRGTKFHVVLPISGTHAESGTAPHSRE